MRILSKIATSTVVIGGALLVAACGHRDNTPPPDTNMTNKGTMVSSAGLTHDASAMDATANDAAATADLNGAAPATENAGNAQ